mmetsp:Transcript_21814/g.72257  ORF Transcript_21814/g.72257 Transcript_21814/m.72257 type:complete len:240 (-) Transcript_21814:1483-2202(-)
MRTTPSRNPRLTSCSATPCARCRAEARAPATSTTMSHAGLVPTCGTHAATGPWAGRTRPTACRPPRVRRATPCPRLHMWAITSPCRSPLASSDRASLPRSPATSPACFGRARCRATVESRSCPLRWTSPRAELPGSIRPLASSSPTSRRSRGGSLLTPPKSQQSRAAFAAGVASAVGRRPERDGKRSRAAAASLRVPINARLNSLATGGVPSNGMPTGSGGQIQAPQCAIVPPADTAEQ